MRHASIGFAVIVGVGVGIAIGSARTPEAAAALVQYNGATYVTHDEDARELTVWTITDGRATSAREVRIVGFGDEKYLAETVYKLREAAAGGPAK